MYIKNKDNYENMCVDCISNNYPKSGDLNKIYNSKCKNKIENDLLDQYDNTWFINSDATPAFYYKNKIYNMNKKKTETGENIINQDVCPKLKNDGLKVDKSGTKIKFKKNIIEVSNDQLIQKSDSEIKKKLESLSDNSYTIKNTNYGKNSPPLLVPQKGITDTLFNNDKEKYFSLCADCNDPDLVPDIPEIKEYCKKDQVKKKNFENQWINNLHKTSEEECISSAQSNYIAAYVKNNTVYNMNTLNENIDKEVCPLMNDTFDINYSNPLSGYRTKNFDCSDIKNLQKYGVNNLNNYREPVIYKKNIETYCLDFAYSIDKLYIDQNNIDTYLSDQEFCEKLEHSSINLPTNIPLQSNPSEKNIIEYCQYLKGFWAFEDDLVNNRNIYYGLKLINNKYYWAP